MFLIFDVFALFRLMGFSSLVFELCFRSLMKFVLWVKDGFGLFSVPRCLETIFRLLLGTKPA